MLAARSNIHISFDLWTSPNYYTILYVNAHFINENGQRRTVLLGLRRVIGEHSGENMAVVLLELFKEYCIDGRIGFFMLDNAELNDTCVEVVLKTLYPNMTVK
jgi:hypothetical protein